METVRTNVVFPRELYSRLEKVAGRGKKNKFIVQAIDFVLKHEMFKKNFKHFHGGWSDSAHPELCELNDLKKYFSNMRKTERGLH